MLLKRSNNNDKEITLSPILASDKGLGIGKTYAHARNLPVTQRKELILYYGGQTFETLALPTQCQLCLDQVISNKQTCIVINGQSSKLSSKIGAKEARVSTAII